MSPGAEPAGRPFGVALAVVLVSAFLVEVALTVWLPQVRVEALRPPRVYSTALEVWLSFGAYAACAVAIGCVTLAIPSWIGPIARKSLLWPSPTSR